jgi:hypothetical protein
LQRRYSFRAVVTEKDVQGSMFQVQRLNTFSDLEH